MVETLDEQRFIRFMPGTSKRIKKLLRAFPGRWDSETHFYRAAVSNFTMMMEQQKFERDLNLAHEKRLKKVTNARRP